MTVIKVLVILKLISSMSHLQGQELHVSYMDGITVKISEQYKPPPRINLPISYAQRLSQNKQLQDNMPCYSFEIERRVKEQLDILKRIKNEADENRKLRSERIKEELKVRKEEAEKEMSEKKKVSSPIFVNEESSRSNGILQPVRVKSCGILTPIPLNNSGSQINSGSADRSPFNISDFEADTSSPFDNMELKTLNDMEELAQVLRSETTNNVQMYPTVQTIPSHSYYNSFTEQQTNSFLPNYTHPIMYNGTASTPYSSYTYNPNYTTTTHKTVPDLLKALEVKLSITDGKVEENRKRIIEDSDDIFLSLPKNLQDLTTTISTMGFPRARVAKACQLYGDNHKKVL